MRGNGNERAGGRASAAAGGTSAGLHDIMRVVSYMLKGYKLPFCLVVICILGSAIATLSGTLFIQSLIDDYITPLLATGLGAADFSGLAAALLRLACVFAVGVACAYAYNRIMVTISQGTMERLRSELFAHMERLPIRYFDTHAHGDIMSVYTNDVDTLRQLMSQTIPQTVNSGVTVVTTLASMLALSVPLSVLSLAMVGIMIAATAKVSGLSGTYFMRQQRDLGAVNGYIEEMMAGQKVVKVFCHEDETRAGFTRINERLRESAEAANTYAGILMPINANLGNISYVLCAGIGALLAISGSFGLTLGTIVSFLTLNKSFSQPITQISQQLNSAIQAGAGAARVFELLEQDPETDTGYVKLVCAERAADGELVESPCRTGLWAWKHPHRSDGTVTYTPLEGDIMFENVTFGYTDEKMVLHDVSLHAESGQKIAFVGATGAGKTTITNLINRFYDIQEGKIRYDGINVGKIAKADLRRSLGIVLQDTHLFTGTVMDNIRYGRLDATDEECRSAARLANADSFIRRLPEGYDTVLTSDGANLSQGQRQLIAIARAAVADPPVLILDEATSSIDTRTERMVQDGMDSLMVGRTSFVIAHRLSTVKNADCIMVMEGGRILEQGTHDELLAAGGKYAALYNSQFA